MITATAAQLTGILTGETPAEAEPAIIKTKKTHKKVKNSDGDVYEAARYCKLSADQGNACGQYNYGYCLEHGKGVEKDVCEAARYFKLAARSFKMADQGDADTQSNYDVCLEHGEGVEEDACEGIYYSHDLENVMNHCKQKEKKRKKELKCTNI